jgi:hypothetical protein
MTISDLIAELEAILEREGDLEVLCAIQPSYPLAHRLEAVTLHTDACEADDDDASDEQVVWLAASGDHPYARSPYAPRGAWLPS